MVTLISLYVGANLDRSLSCRFLAEIGGVGVMNYPENSFAVRTDHDEHVYPFNAGVPSVRRRNPTFAARAFHVHTS